MDDENVTHIETYEPGGPEGGAVEIPPGDGVAKAARSHSVCA